MQTTTTRHLRQAAIRTGFNLFRATGIHRFVAPLTRGIGTILTFHHVRPWTGTAFGPNRGLEITPEYLETVILTLRASGFEIIAIDAAIRRLTETCDEPGRPFAVLSFDDGYRDNLEFALPILRRHGAPFVLFVTTGFADRTGRMWWVELEAAVRQLSKIDLSIGRERLVYSAMDDTEKGRAAMAIYWRLRDEPEDVLRAAIRDLAAAANLDGRAIVENECMDWGEIATLAADPLCTIGSHTLTHRRLATCATDLARQELTESRKLLSSRLGIPVRHLAYPIGDAAAAGVREFGLAAEAGYASAVTTRPGMLFRQHHEHLMALPRLSVNGAWQSRAALEVLLSGAPFLIWNRGRRVNA